MLTVISGCMFSGKTTSLLRYIECAKIAGQTTIILKPAIDTRCKIGVSTHAGTIHEATIIPVMPLQEDMNMGSYDVYGIEEAQFLHYSWIKIIEQLAHKHEVVCSCLNQDYTGKPFGIAPTLMAMADEVVIVKAVCMKCKKKNTATKTHRLASDDGQIVIGGAEKYQALCRDCWLNCRGQ